MWPEIAEFELFGRPVAVHGYGLMIGLGGTAWIVLVAREAKRRGLEGLRANLVLVLLAMVAAGWVGGKLFYVLTSGGEVTAETAGAGFVYYGSLLAAIPTLGFLAARLGAPPLTALDVFMTPAPLLHTFGRLGCFLAGCCYGHRCDLPWAVTFREGHGQNGVPLHPVQLYESVGLLVLFLVLWFVVRPRQRFAGQIALAYLGGYAVLRIVTEQFRGDPAREFVTGQAAAPGEPAAGLSTSTVVSLGMLVVCAVLWALASRRAGRAPRTA